MPPHREYLIHGVETLLTTKYSSHPAKNHVRTRISLLATVFNRFYRDYRQSNRYDLLYLHMKSIIIIIICNHRNHHM